MNSEPHDVESLFSEDFCRQYQMKYERLLREKNELLAVLRELLTKPACSSCIRAAQEIILRINNE